MAQCGLLRPDGVVDDAVLPVACTRRRGALRRAARLRSAMLASIILALDAIRRRDFAAHGTWMACAYASGLGAGTQVLTHLPWLVLAEGRPGELPRAVMMGAAWGDQCDGGRVTDPTEREASGASVDDHARTCLTSPCRSRRSSHTARPTDACSCIIGLDRAASAMRAPQELDVRLGVLLEPRIVRSAAEAFLPSFVKPSWSCSPSSTAVSQPLVLRHCMRRLTADG